jgi:hypothetical protein
MILRPGDVLLYKATSVYGRIIAVKTWHPIAHVEVYVGNGFSVASRDGQGTGQYPVRTSDIAVVCRPPNSFDLGAARRWFLAQPHRDYGWLDLLQFTGWNVNTNGVVCSPFATEFLRAGHFDPFNGEPAPKIAPFEFALVDEMQIYPVLKGEICRAA